MPKPHSRSRPRWAQAPAGAWGNGRGASGTSDTRGTSGGTSGGAPEAETPDTVFVIDAMLAPGPG